ncbi:formyltetrahydrofolate deformylase [Natronolimnohabitans sp. A-GB9]|uniref:formyltetrahydrofolate deformylase n=1 Tax=Natronolimnohabitans sp. A-GB9 TaxID=3069757 RepID=UPI0027B4F54A|nr:formyltetrahydrofolate deformylase [Natronolimnohabitans sp. A-GB9]MDQ2051739.1 formyltetrahydrofolate deformylase [Natronolimnohabitans sp. A-GB9]
MSRDRTEITIVGDEDSGVIADATDLLFEHDVDIVDLDQAVREGTCRTTLQVEIDEMTVSRDRFREELDDLADEFAVDVQVRFPSSCENQSLAVLVTKESHCLEALLEAWENDELGADIEVVIGNHDILRPLAAAYDVPFYDIGDENGTPDEGELLELLSEYEIDLIALARYIQILSPEVVFRYEKRIINVHPSLLPAFPGAAAYRQAHEAGVRIAGVTAHYVTTDLDQGPIITQRAFNVPAGASEADLKERGQPLEADALLEAIRLHLEDELVVDDGQTKLADPDGADTQLGAPTALDQANPSRPIDNREELVADGETTAVADD